MSIMSVNNETLQEKKKKKRIVYYFYFLIFVIVVIYSVVWFYLANNIENRVSTELLNNQSGEMAVQCDNLHKTGYPLRIGVGCNRLNFNLGQSIKLTSQSLSSTAPIYAPHWLKFDIAAPLNLQTPLANIEGNWTSLNIETNTRPAHPDKMQLIVDNPDLRFTDKFLNYQGKISAKFLRFDSHDLGADAKMHLAFKDLDLPFTMPQENTKIPLLDGNLDWTIKDVQMLFQNQEKLDQRALLNHLRGVTGVVDRAKLSFASGGSLIVSGPIAVDGNGYINAELQITIDDQRALLQTMRQLFPSQANNLQPIFFVIGSMPKDKDGNPILSLAIDEGEIRLGFIRLGRLDPI